MKNFHKWNVVNDEQRNEKTGMRVHRRQLPERIKQEIWTLICMFDIIVCTGKRIWVLSRFSSQMTRPNHHGLIRGCCFIRSDRSEWINEHDHWLDLEIKCWWLNINYMTRDIWLSLSSDKNDYHINTFRRTRLQCKAMKVEYLTGKST